MSGERDWERPSSDQRIYSLETRRFLRGFIRGPGSLSACAGGTIDPGGEGQKNASAAGGAGGRRELRWRRGPQSAPPCAVPGTRDNRTMSNSESDFTMKDGVLRFRGKPEPVPWWVEGPVVNSVTERKEKLREWKERVALAVRDKRGGDPWCPDHLYAVTVQFHFRPLRNQKLDVDNFVKPVLDGLAAGLFLPEDKDPRDLPTFAAHHGVDDSNFRILLIHRLRDQEPPEEGGVRLFVSTTGKAPPG